MPTRRSRTSWPRPGLSTRSFYRHFESKDQLLCALYRHEAEAGGRRG